MSIRVEPVTPVQGTKMNTSSQGSRDGHSQLLENIVDTIVDVRSGQSGSEPRRRNFLDLVFEQRVKDDEEQKKKTEDAVKQAPIIDPKPSIEDMRRSQNLIDMLANPWVKDK